MPIEFRCPSCDKLLRTPDGTAGKQAKCPQCGNLTAIPASSTAASPPPPGSAPGEFSGYPPVPPAQTGQGVGERSAYTVPPVSANPYQSSYTGEPRLAVGGATQFQPTVIDFNTVFSKTWEIYKNSLGMSIVGPFLSSLCMGLVVGLLFGLMAPVAEQLDGAVAAVFVLVMILAIAAVIAFFYAGMVRYMLMIARGQPAELGALFRGGDVLVPFGVSGLLLIIGAIAGSLLLVIPGVIFALYFLLAPIIVVDRRAGIMESFSLSAQAMRGNQLSTFLLLFCVGAIAGILHLLTCGLSSILVTPFQMLLMSVLYLMTSGQTTAADLLFSAGYAGAERAFQPPQSPTM